MAYSGAWMVLNGPNWWNSTLGEAAVSGHNNV